MKARNNKEITLGYLKFTIALGCSVAIAVCSVCSFIATSKTEIASIGRKTGEYDKTYAWQAELVDKMDSVYNYMTLLNSSDRINDIVVMSIVSARNVDFSNRLQEFGRDDAQAYCLLSGRLKGFMALKDSIRMRRIDQQLLYGDLQRCIQDNRQAVRKLSLGGRVIEK
jgi:hypothetical protein